MLLGFLGRRGMAHALFPWELLALAGSSGRQKGKLGPGFGTWLLVDSLGHYKMPKSLSPIGQEGAFPGMLRILDPFSIPRSHSRRSRGGPVVALNA